MKLYDDAYVYICIMYKIEYREKKIVIYELVFFKIILPFVHGFDVYILYMFKSLAAIYGLLSHL